MLTVSKALLSTQDTISQVLPIQEYREEASASTHGWGKNGHYSSPPLRSGCRLPLLSASEPAWDRISLWLVTFNLHKLIQQRLGLYVS